MSAGTVAFDVATGLAPAVVQDSVTNRVLMLGYVNEESLRLTNETGFVHFWSRSRNQVWKKGETSDNTLRVVSVSLDCDDDTVLFRVRPAGPTCHQGNTTCFDPTEESPTEVAPVRVSFRRLTLLWDTISSRACTPPEDSYTARLLLSGVDGIGRKIIEEATEVLLAARDHRDGGSPERVDEEVADLLYHIFVLLAERRLDPAGVMSVLEERTL